MIAHLYSGKVRELYRADDGTLLLVATDRISAFDYVLDTPIPDKGKILTKLSLLWFSMLADIVPNHVIDAPGPAEAMLAGFGGRAMACKSLSMIGVECVARGYLAGSGLTEYRRDGRIGGVELPPGLVEGSKLPEPIFTPAIKASGGSHDENITAGQLVELVGDELAADLARLTLAVYSRGARIAADRGLIVADTKLEFGLDADGVLTLGDELLTPDSSRLWLAERWQPGRSQPSLDKQPVRDWLTGPESGWNPDSGQPPPPLPSHIVRRTREAYLAAYHRITGLTWEDAG